MPSQSAAATHPVKALLSAHAVRERAHEMLALALDGRLEHFFVDLSALEQTADLVLSVIREAYPDLSIPFHARWRHIEAGGIDRFGAIMDVAGYEDPLALGRSAYDLAILSVLLDAGAGAQWSYEEASTGLSFNRSEGLAVASVDMFASGLFSGDPGDPFRADAHVLAALETADLAHGFQISSSNPMIGLEGRTGLLKRLGAHVASRPDLFARGDLPRPGGLFDLLIEKTVDGALPAPVILETVLDALGPIWPSRLTIEGIALGDCWRHTALKRADATNGLVPLHKLSQWLSYSLIEPLQWTGVEVTDIDGLTGLAEYRNGGLFVDCSVLTLKDEAQLAKAHAVDEELVVEWRALTVALLDLLAGKVRDRLGLDAFSLPLARVLEGGSWAAGRRIARELRADGGPPISILSDGTVF